MIRKRTLSVLSAFALGFWFAIVAVNSSAEAAPSAPPDDRGFYISTTSTQTAYNAGKSDGEWDDDNGAPNRIAYLDFGGQDSNGSENTLTNAQPITYAQIEAVAENYAYGWYVGTGTDSTSELLVVIGTNNSLDDISVAGGQAWAGVVQAVEDSTYGEDVASQVLFLGGNDIEAWEADTTADDVEFWADGFDDSGLGYVDFGSADGCSETAYGSGAGLECSTQTDTGTNDSFYQDDYWLLAWGNANALVLPQIYSPGNAEEWDEICLYGDVELSGGAIQFEGPLNEYDLDSSTLSAGSSWKDFWNDLSSGACAQTPPYEEEAVDETS
jgi:hypothetical protein